MTFRHAVMLVWVLGSLSCLTGRPAPRRALEAASLVVREADRRCADVALVAWDLRRADACATAYSSARAALLEAEDHADGPAAWCHVRKAVDAVLDLVVASGSDLGRSEAAALHATAAERCP